MTSIQEINQALYRLPRVVTELGPEIDKSGTATLYAVIVKDQPESTTNHAHELLDNLYEQPYRWNNALYLEKQRLNFMQHCDMTGKCLYYGASVPHVMI